jgi:N-acetylglucosaminyl-diphospho-decaprenol L-rhamnosyltransferase
MITPAVRVVVVTYNGAHLLPRCLDALLSQTGGPAAAEVVVVDNASTDGTPALLTERYPTVRVVQAATNTGFAGGVTLGLADCSAPIVVLVNNDAVVAPGFLDAIVEPFADRRVGAVCAKVLLADGSEINSVGVEVTTDGYGRDRGWREPDDGRYDTATEVMAGSGSALALRLAAVQDAGGIDASYFLYYEDVDLTWRMRLLGWSVVTAPAALARHEHSASVGRDSPLHAYYSERNRLLTMVKDGTPRLALTAVLLQPVTTGYVAFREIQGAWRERRRPNGPLLLARVRAFGGFARRLPQALRQRRAVTGRLVVSRADLERRWLVSPK